MGGLHGHRNTTPPLQGGPELSLPQERIKYAMFGRSEVVVRTSIALSASDAHHGDPPPCPRTLAPHRTPHSNSNLNDLTNDLQRCF